VCGCGCVVNSSGWRWGEKGGWLAPLVREKRKMTVDSVSLHLRCKVLYRMLKWLDEGT
jgi:hypothetical protein